MSSSSVNDLYRQVREHPHYVFGTVFSTADLPAAAAADDRTRALLRRGGEDALASAGQQYIADICGEDFDEPNAAADDSIFDLMAAVRAHPDTLFATVFIAADFPAGVLPATFAQGAANDTLAQAGNELLEQILGPDADEDD